MATIEEQPCLCATLWPGPQLRGHKGEQEREQAKHSHHHEVFTPVHQIHVGHDLGVCDPLEAEGHAAAQALKDK